MKVCSGKLFEMSENPNSFTFEVELPKKSTYSSFSRPKASLKLFYDQQLGESYPIPVACGKKLLSDAKGVNIQTRDQLFSLFNQICLDEAYQYVVGIFAKRDYSSLEIQQKLSLRGYRQQTIDATLDKIKSIGLLSDTRFAESYIRAKISCGWGSYKISRSLGLKGIDVQDIDGWPDQYFEDEVSRALSILQHRTVPEKNPYEKCVRRLVSKGFSISDAKAATKAFLED